MAMWTSNSSDPKCSADLIGPEYIVFVVCNSISGTVAIIGNGIILLVVYRSRRLHTASNMLLCSLAAADLSVGLIVNPMYIALTTTKTWVTPTPLYKFENYIWIQTLITTSFSLTAISVDRYFAVTCPFRYQKLVKKKPTRWVIVFIWTFSAIFPSVICIQASDSILWVSSLVITFLLPAFIMSYCNFRVFRTAQSQINKIRFSSKYCTVEIKGKFNNHKASCTIGIIIGFFIILFSPNFVFSVIEFSSNDVCFKLHTYRSWLWGIFIAFSSSAVNPFVYAIRIKTLRKACLTAVTRFICKDSL
ncbi:beta-1 adrenergic receptor-like [Exaiptasia diaphana]|uniref:G-protein coupled receptors family 1 profile domain-containing protein n=1 Tax=Exaiptasia diaphana TaxID=2652724 RepID=A0A913XF79_EXADI|nr:beta-1 adrenergic receptor-like [Exaiptasia diaphana]